MSDVIKNKADKVMEHDWGGQGQGEDGPRRLLCFGNISSETWMLRRKKSNQKKKKVKEQYSTNKCKDCDVGLIWAIICKILNFFSKPS